MPDIRKDGLKVIIGLGKTGFSCAQYLINRGHEVAIVDSRTNPPYLDKLQNAFPKVQIALGDFEHGLLDKASELIVSPGVSLKEPALAKRIRLGVPALGDIELFARAVTTPVIAVTGSNGKSTVTTLVGEMVKDAGYNVKVGGNLGQPALDLLGEKEPDFYVLELSSFQLETTSSLKPIAATILNITPDHLDRYKDFNEYLNAKQRIYHQAKNIIINRDDPASFANLSLNRNVISFGLNIPLPGSFGLEKDFLLFGTNKLIASSELKIRGQHQVANALAALALGKAIDLPLDSMLETLKNFRGLEHRCQWVRNLNGVDWYNDSKGTNVGATEAAIKGFGKDIAGKIILIAGGIGKGADFSSLRPAVQNYIRTLILIGRDAPLIETALRGTCEIIPALAMADAVAKARGFAKPGDIVLLSPACASFDMFTNFEHRGQAFSELVRNL